MATAMPPVRLTALGRALAMAAALGAVMAVLACCFLIGQARQDHWCTTHPSAAQTAETCPNPALGGTR